MDDQYTLRIKHMEFLQTIESPTHEFCLDVSDFIFDQNHVTHRTAASILKRSIDVFPLDFSVLV